MGRIIDKEESLGGSKPRQSRTKNAESQPSVEAGSGGGGGGFGKWLREHLGGGSRSGHDVGAASSKSSGNTSGNEKPLGRAVCTSQNLYCSLPREHGRHGYSAGRKIGGSLRPQGHDRQRSGTANHLEKSTLNDLGTLTRGGPIYGSEGRPLKKRNRDRRRHSLNEAHEQGRQRRRREERMVVCGNFKVFATMHLAEAIFVGLIGIDVGYVFLPYRWSEIMDVVVSREI
ncbi:hypothetical protein KM043_016730 [Ampulex compressa]|nr:hypothetical protein KM043_016730 [Ampulex compressa]